MGLPEGQCAFTGRDDQRVVEDHEIGSKLRFRLGVICRILGVSWPHHYIGVIDEI